MLAYAVILLAIAGALFAGFRMRRGTRGRRRAVRREAAHIHIRTTDRDE